MCAISSLRMQGRTFVDVGDEVAQLVAGGGQRRRDALGALVQRVALRRVVVQQRPLLLCINGSAVNTCAMMLTTRLSASMQFLVGYQCSISQQACAPGTCGRPPPQWRPASRGPPSGAFPAAPASFQAPPARWRPASGRRRDFMPRLALATSGSSLVAAGKVTDIPKGPLQRGRQQRSACGGSPSAYRVGRFDSAKQMG